MDSRLGVHGSLERDCEPAVPIGRVYLVCRLLVLYTDFAYVARERRCVGELKSGCLQTKLTLAVILLLQYMFYNELCVLYLL